MRLSPYFVAPAALLLVAAAVPTDSWAQRSTGGAQLPLEVRVQRLEQMLESGGLVDLLVRIERLQQEVQELRGEVENQSHAIEGLQQRQRDLYVDLDQRIGRLESGASPPVTGAAGYEPGPGETGSGPAPEPGIGPGPESGAGSGSPEGAGTAAGPVDEAAEQRAYEQAFDLLKQGRYADASNAFVQFLANFPSGRYTANAQYWLGESYYVTRRFDSAMSEFQKVIDGFPDSNKVPDALLKMGYIYYEQGDKAQARKLLTQVQQQYPNSGAARLAEQRLQLLRQQNGGR